MITLAFRTHGPHSVVTNRTTNTLNYNTESLDLHRNSFDNCTNPLSLQQNKSPNIKITSLVHRTESSLSQTEIVAPIPEISTTCTESPHVTHSQLPEQPRHTRASTDENGTPVTISHPTLHVAPLEGEYTVKRKDIIHKFE